MKKKILLKTLIPLTTVGISLGTALPLVSCSCGNKNGYIETFGSALDFAVFLIATCNSVLTSNEDYYKDWSTGYQGGDDSYPVNDPGMIAWFNKIVDVRMFTAFFELERVGEINFAFPCEFQFINDTAIFIYTITQFVDDIPVNKECVDTATKDSTLNSFKMVAVQAGVPTPFTGSIARAGTYTEGIGSGSRAIVFSGNIPKSFTLPDPEDSGLWTDVKFPTGNPYV